MSRPVPDRIQAVELFAWLGEDEKGSGVVGIKQGLVPAGYIPLVATEAQKMERLHEALATQAFMYGHKIYLCKFTFAGLVMETKEGLPPK